MPTVPIPTMPIPLDALSNQLFGAAGQCFLLCQSSNFGSRLQVASEMQSNPEWDLFLGLC